MKTPILKHLLITTTLINASLVILWFVIKPPPILVEEYYSRGIYTWISARVTPLISAIPFSVSSVCTILLCCSFIVASFVLLRHRKHTLWLIVTLHSISILPLSFIVMWGANYKRQPIEEYMSLTQSINDTTTNDLVTYLLEIIQQNASDISLEEQNSAIRAISQSLQDSFARKTTLPENVKTLPAGTLFRWHSSGVMSPWLLEPHVDNALPAPYFIAVAAHELAHSAGYAGEADADFLGMFAALQANNQHAKYAGALYALNNLFAEVSPELQTHIRNNLPEITQQQQQAYRNVLETYQPTPLLGDLQQRSYDVYLRSQGVTEGIQDYDRSATLLLQAYQQGLFSNTY